MTRKYEDKKVRRLLKITKAVAAERITSDSATTTSEAETVAATDHVLDICARARITICIAIALRAEVHVQTVREARRAI